MADPTFPATTKAATAGGTIMVVLFNITAGDILRTAILAATGAVVSYIVSIILKRVFKKWQK